MNIIDFANSFQAKSVLELDGIRTLMDKLGNPQNKLKFIHVAGTNGKGSACAFLQTILTKHGLKCGKFSSPYMIVPEDRISIDGKNIEREEFQNLLIEVGKFASGQSQFELWTAVAFCYFLKEKCDVVILECGMGGLGDATNIIPAPECAVITRIGLDHTDYLGNTIEEITENKCGIIKENTKFTVTCKQETTEIIEKFAKGDFLVSENISAPISLSGEHQKENAGIAYTVCKAIGIPDETICWGLNNTKHPGRLEFFDLNPPVLFDGAHNPQGVTELCKNLPDGNFTLICAFMADKDLDNIFRILKENNVHKRAEIFCTTVTNNPRAMPPEKLTDIAKKYGFKTTVYQNINDALKARKEYTVVFGSLYLYEEFLKALDK